MKKWLVLLMTVAMGLSAVGCGGTAEETTEAESTVAETSAETSAEETTAEVVKNVDAAALALYQSAVEKEATLTNKVEKAALSTIQSDGTNTQETKTDFHIKTTSVDGVEEMGVTGTLLQYGETADIEIYYKDGVIYERRGEEKMKQEYPFESALAYVDIMSSFHEQLAEDYFINLTMTQNADGSSRLDLTFSGPINGTQVDGSGTITVSADGYILEQKYEIVAELEYQGTAYTITQVLEGSLLEYGEAVQPVEFPDLSEYQELTTEEATQADGGTTQEGTSEESTESSAAN